MKEETNYEVIIVGGSYAGLSAAMALGRSLRKVLILDSGMPCNRQTPHSHNFVTQDGQTPSQIAKVAKEQVLKYDSITFRAALATSGTKTSEGFEIGVDSGELFKCKKLIFATGLEDIMPDINGFAECWGISVLHCPYCHGYEVRGDKIGILANGDIAAHYAPLIFNLTKELAIFTNGRSTLTEEQSARIRKNNIPIIETEVETIEHAKGEIQYISFKDGSKTSVSSLFSRPPFIQHCLIPEHLGCRMGESGLIEVDALRQTSVDGVYACGDNSGTRAVSVAIASGTMAGAAVNHALAEGEF